MTLEEVLSAADSDNENDKEFKDFQERMVFHWFCISFNFH